MTIDKEKLLKDLIEDYRQKHKQSGQLFERASRSQVRGGSHNIRLFDPFPFYDVRSSGSQVTDIDGNTYVDFWQGHFANILGHNPAVVLKALTDYFQKGQGLITGFPGNLQLELAELLLERIDADQVRFTASGTLATMYAIMLAKAFSGRELVMKVGGGWHGAQPFVLKGISEYKDGLNRMESAGLFPEHDTSIVITKFNNIEDLRETFAAFGERIACLIIEPFIGAGGFIFAAKEYLQEARELTDRYGAVLIFDEVVSGFRFHAGGVQSLYGIKPDLSVFGKAIGGGMPVSAVAGKREVMGLCDPGTTPGRNVKFEGGTYSAHPAAMLAGITFIKYLVAHEQEIYPKIGRMGARVRRGIENIFSRYGFPVHCTGAGDGIAKESSIVGVHFVKEKAAGIKYPEEVWNPGVCDVELREKIFKLAMMNEGFYIFHGFGAISDAHSEAEVDASLEAVERIAKAWTRYRKND